MPNYQCPIKANEPHLLFSAIMQDLGPDTNYTPLVYQELKKGKETELF